MEYIYARLSCEKRHKDGKVETEAEIKIRLLNQVNIIKMKYPQAGVITEITSGYYQKPELEKLIAALRAGDTLIVAALDRLGRNSARAVDLINDLAARRVTLVSLREGLDTSTPMGRCIATFLFAVAEMERTLASERIKAGMAVKKALAEETGNGWKCGRRPKLTPTDIKRAQALRDSGWLVQAIANDIGCSKSRIVELTTNPKRRRRR